jgi:hypothetical protein
MPTYSRVLTTANGVQGRMDFTIPEGGVSLSEPGISALDEDAAGERRDLGSMKRILQQPINLEKFGANAKHRTCDRGYNEI